MSFKLFLESKRPELLVSGLDRFDGSVQFYQHIQPLITSETVLLDYGAGRGAAGEDPIPYRRGLQIFKGRVKEVIGADVDPIVLTNPSLDRGVLIGTDGTIPLADESVDLIISDWTFEHISDPPAACAELERVLKPGGWLCARTTNRYGYISIANSLVPEGLSKSSLKAAQPHRKERDVFVAHYKMNTKSAIHALFPSARYERHVLFWDASPAYHFDSPFAFDFWRIVQWLTPQFAKTVMLIYLKKLETAS